MTTPRRRWFAFSLRTLLVVMTVFGLGLGWLALELGVVRERQDVARLIEGRDGSGVMWRTDLKVLNLSHADLGKSKISWVRSVLGDDTAISVCVPPDEVELFQRAQRCFPEAYVFFDVQIGYPPDWEQLDRLKEQRRAIAIDRGIGPPLVPQPQSSDRI